VGRKPLSDEQRQKTRAKILDAAREIFLDKGPEGLSIRPVAERVGISPMTVYLYFDDRQAIIIALVKEGLELLGTRLEAAAKRRKDPHKRLLALGDAYLEFAVEEPHYYDALFLTVPEEQSMDAYGAVFGNVTDAMRPLVQAVAEITGDLAKAMDKCFILWCTLHGFASLQLGDRLTLVGANPTKLQKQLRKVVPQILAG
jgi:AcrR family transcriptional regulator